jgi:hypothetical protein
VGRTYWHPDLQITPFMEIITGKGGEQFDYAGAKHNKEVNFGHFYTSNVSLKRDFLIEEEDLFSTHYRYAAYEDIELAYRLHLSGMIMRYLETARGYHYHAMSLRSFIERQKRVGRMLTLLTIQRPSFVPDEHAVYLKALEFARYSGTQHEILLHTPGWSDGLIESLVRSYEISLESREGLLNPHRRDILDTDSAQWQKWLGISERSAWKVLNELILRYGMAEEWAGNNAEAQWSKDWVVMLTLPKFLGPPKMRNRMPFTRMGLDVVFFDSKIISWTAVVLRKIPFIRSIFFRVRESRLGQGFKNRLIKLIQR